MSPTRRICQATALAVLAAPACALAASTVRPAGKTDRAALVRALVRQDGTSAGVTGVSISRSHPSLAVVCQRTPDGGRVAYLFKRRGHAWSYLTDSRSAAPRSALERGLERAC
ncbi:MAG: hypothetical protein QOF77_1630 [Solirubrobacteraceae bacterium]|jgi:hypothetical protein|nr:hypothetical protein [Solirubrobacteraceae bacterium]